MKDEYWRMYNEGLWMNNKCYRIKEDEIVEWMLNDEEWRRNDEKWRMNDEEWMWNVEEWIMKDE